MKALAEKLWEETVRIERIILIAGAMTDGAFSDDFNEFLDDEDEKTIEECLGRIPDFVDIDGHGFLRNESVCEWMSVEKKLGFLVKFATPVMEKIDSESRSFSWGYYTTKWIYAETLEEAVTKGMEWVKQRREDEDKKPKKAKKAKKGGTK